MYIETENFINHVKTIAVMAQSPSAVSEKTKVHVDVVKIQS